jgi:c-di-GMP-binding flagellar brake protein YcgR
MAGHDDELRERKYPRVKEACKIKYRLVEDQAAAGIEQGAVAVNISGGGMRFMADEAFKPGAMVALDMSLSHLPNPVVALARVVWCETSEKPGKYEVGVEFWWVGWADTEAQAKMLAYINKKLEEMGEGEGETAGVT